MSEILLQQAIREIAKDGEFLKTDLAVKLALMGMKYSEALKFVAELEQKRRIRPVRGDLYRIL